MPSRPPPPRRNANVYDTSTPWYVILARTLFLAAIAYFIAAFIFLVLDQISQAPHGPLWDSSFSGPFLFVMMIAVIGIMMVPFFQKEWDPGLRTFCLFAAVFLVGYAIFRGSNGDFFNAQIPLRFVQAHVFDPIHRLVGY